MHILAVGLNHKTAPVEIRERLAFQEAELDEALIQLKNQKSVFEAVIVSTCNRTELYVVSDQQHTGRYYAKAFLCDWFGVRRDDIDGYLFVKEDEEAVRHLFHVACGLDSLVIGETQILGQVRDAFMKAQSVGATGTFFNELFKEAITVAKRAHAETMIDGNAVSVSYAAVELALKIFGDLKDKQVLILGAGEMAELAVTHLRSRGAKSITVANRTYEKAQELAARFQGQAASLTEIHQHLSEADILIASTGAKDFVLTAADMNRVSRARKGKPLFIVDIAVPRDVEPAVGDLEGVFLYDIDDLEGVVRANLEERKQTAEKIAVMIEEQIRAFNRWVRELGVVPVIAALRQKALAIQADTMKSIERKIPDLTERERKVLNKHTKSIVNQLLRDPIQRVKEYAAEPGAEAKLAAFIDIFGLGDAVREQASREKAASESRRVVRPDLGEAPSGS